MTHIRVPPNGLDGLIIEVARVAHQASGNLVCVLETLEQVGCDGELGALSQLHALIVALCVDALDPIMVLLGVLDVLLEDDHVRVGDLLSMCRGEDGGGVLVDGVDLEGR